MAYVKNTWVDQKVQRPKTYNFTTNDDGSTTLIDAFGNVEELGTPVNADNMNHIEDGLANVGMWTYNSTLEYNKDDAVIAIIDDKFVLYKSLQNNNKGNALTNTDYWEEVKLGGSAGLEVCDIGTALYIDETKGLRRRLNGQIVDINTNTQAFLDKLVKIKVLTPSLFCTEEEWQAIKTASKLGQCGKFVFNYTGATITSIRIPAVVNINGLVDMANAGLIKEESLPNLKGIAVSSATSNYLNNTDWRAGVNSYGLFEDDNYPGGPLKYVSLNGGNVNTVEIHQGTFNASRSSSAYKDNAPVQQEAIQYPYFIQIATGVETEVNIKDTLELNNPFTFGMNMYFKGEMKNISWLKSSGQQNPKGTYPDFYNWVLANANAGKDGFKLSTASDITDYDFEVNTTDETFRLPLKNGQEGVFASGVKGNGMTLGLTDGTNNYGLFMSGNGGGALTATTGTYNRLVSDSVIQGSQSPTSRQYGVTTDATKSGMVIDTTVPTGYNLYYFVGETVKNPNLIDAGRIGENLVNKLDTPPRYPVEISDKSLMPSWYVVYNDGWCEQGGMATLNIGQTLSISLMKAYTNINYSILQSMYTTNNQDIWGYGNKVASVTTSSFSLYVNTSASGNICWCTSGYIA
mgnify:CR=1 FL=1